MTGVETVTSLGRRPTGATEAAPTTCRTTTGS